MKRDSHRLVAALSLCLFLCGCATHYDLTMTNGDVVRARTKPELNEQGYFVFQDLAGQQTEVNRMRIREITPVRRGGRPTRAY